MKTLNTIASSLRETCFDVEKNITGLSEKKASLWAKANSIRHAHTLRAIISHSLKNNKNEVNILNASGLHCGHQDFSIVEYLRNNAMKIEWTVFESPNNEYLENKFFQDYLDRLSINLELDDFSNSSELYGRENEVFDIVLFTEIAEHLDHTTLLRALENIRRKLKRDGVLIVTTPNLVSLTNRIRIILGNGDGPYWGDGKLNCQKGLYGHVVVYDLTRLKRLLLDIGFRVEKGYTFNHLQKKGAIKFIAQSIIDLVSRFVRNSKQTIFIMAKKSDPVDIPFEV